MDKRPRLLVVGPSPGSLDGSLAAADVTFASTDPADISSRLHGDPFQAVVASPEVIAEMLDRAGRNEVILSHVEMGLAILDPTGQVVWANPAFLECCESDPLGRTLSTALGGEMASTSGSSEFHVHPLVTAAGGQPAVFRLHRPSRHQRAYLEVNLCPVLDPSGTVARIVVLVRDVTAEVTQQQKLDALHAAGRELSGLDPDQLDEMNVPTRVELLKLNLRRYIREILHYDTIEIRLLDRKTGELKPLLEDGMTREAADRILFAAPTENGVTGYVAHSGLSYLCPDTARDPHFLEGAKGTRSSLTVPLKFQEQVIGTLNVESPRADAFGPEDLKFTELFSKEVAGALHTLDLLNAQQVCTASQSIDAINREIALPIDDVLASASLLIGRHPDNEAALHLRRIIDRAREVKESIAKVGREIAASPIPSGDDGRGPLSGKRVLVVDTDERMRRSAHWLLGRLGAKVETAANGNEGLALGATNAYDAVLLDIKPGDIRGSEAHRRFKALCPAASLALTTGFGYDDDHTIVRARQEGLRHVLFKPFKPDQVIKAVLDGTFASAFEADPFRSEVPAHS